MTWLKLLVAFFQGLASAWLARMERDGTNRDLGAKGAQIELDREVKDVADEQNRINTTDRGGARDVLERLRGPWLARRPRSFRMVMSALGRIRTCAHASGGRCSIP